MKQFESFSPEEQPKLPLIETVEDSVSNTQFPLEQILPHQPDSAEQMQYIPLVRKKSKTKPVEHKTLDNTLSTKTISESIIDATEPTHTIDTGLTESMTTSNEITNTALETTTVLSKTKTRKNLLTNTRTSPSRVKNKKTADAVLRKATGAVVESLSPRNTQFGNREDIVRVGTGYDDIPLVKIRTKKSTTKDIPPTIPKQTPQPAPTNEVVVGEIIDKSEDLPTIAKDNEEIIDAEHTHETDIIKAGFETIAANNTEQYDQSVWDEFSERYNTLIANDKREYHISTKFGYKPLHIKPLTKYNSMFKMDKDGKLIAPENRSLPKNIDKLPSDKAREARYAEAYSYVDRYDYLLNLAKHGIENRDFDTVNEALGEIDETPHLRIAEKLYNEADRLYTPPPFKGTHARGNNAEKGAFDYRPEEDNTLENRDVFHDYKNEAGQQASPRTNKPPVNIPKGSMSYATQQPLVNTTPEIKKKSLWSRITSFFTR